MNIERIKSKVKVKDQKKLFKVIQIDFEEEQIQIDNPYMAGTIIIYNFEYIEQLLQWTGFKDQKCKDLYEYDLVRNIANGENYVIKWLKDDGCFAFIPIQEFLKKDYRNWEMLQSLPNCEDEDHYFIKIGNYFENLEDIKTQRGVNELFCKAMDLNYSDVFGNM